MPRKVFSEVVEFRIIMAYPVITRMGSFYIHHHLSILYTSILLHPAYTYAFIPQFRCLIVSSSWCMRGMQCFRRFGLWGWESRVERIWWSNLITDKEGKKRWIADLKWIGLPYFRSSRIKKDIRSERWGVRELQMRAIYPTVADMGGGGILSRCSILYPWTSSFGVFCISLIMK